MRRPSQGRGVVERRFQTATSEEAPPGPRTVAQSAAMEAERPVQEGRRPDPVAEGPQRRRGLPHFRWRAPRFSAGHLFQAFSEAGDK